MRLGVTFAEQVGCLNPYTKRTSHLSSKADLGSLTLQSTHKNIIKRMKHWDEVIVSERSVMHDLKDKRESPSLSELLPLRWRLACQT